MTTTTDGPTPVTRTLRRSPSDRMLTGVAGGLGEYFAVDAVIFRVLFAVLAFFGGIGLLMYLACWLLLPEPGVEVSALDRGIERLRRHRVPPWLVIGGGALVLWLGWFSWWAPGPTLPALALIAVLLYVLIRRLATPGQSGSAGPTAVSTPMAGTTEMEMVPVQGALPLVSESPPAPIPVMPTPTEPLIAPLNDVRQSMGAWYSEAVAAKKRRQERRRPIYVVAGSLLVVGLATIGIIDAVHRAPFGSYLWFIAAVLGLGFGLSVVLRRTAWIFLPPLLAVLVALVVLGGTRASITDGSGKTGRAPTNAAQLTDEHQFAGDTTLDLTRLPGLSAATTVHITQAAGQVTLRIPAGQPTTVIGNVHIGDIRLGTSHAVGDYVAGMNTGLTIGPAAGATGSPLTVIVDLTVGHIQVDRVSS
jgi:phage shock protein PspC (stress-responsive transcriptional regulator)